MLNKWPRLSSSLDSAPEKRNPPLARKRTTGGLLTPPSKEVTIIGAENIMLRRSASQTMYRRERSDPPHVAWRNNPESAAATQGAFIIGRSQSSPPLPSSVSNDTRIHALPLESSHSWRPNFSRPFMESAEYTRLPQSGHLSPIAEARSPELKTIELPSGQSVNERDIIEEHARNSPALSHSSSYFITRPLKKTASQGSNQTLGSTVSASAPPSLPPVDLRPAFSVGIPPCTTRNGRGLSTIAASTRKGSKGEDDREEGLSLRTVSFVTANTSSSTSSLHGDLPAGEPEGGSLGEAGRNEGHLRTPPHDSSRAADLNHSSVAVQPGTDGAPSLRSAKLAPSVTETRSCASTFIDRRWLKDEVYSSAPTLHGDIELQMEHHPEIADKHHTRSARILFWAGFVAGPWCWLIGGWLVADGSGERVSKEGKGKGKEMLLPQWTEQQRESFKTVGLTKPVPCVTWESLRIYPVFAPSAETISSTFHPSQEEGKSKAGALRELQLPRILKQKANKEPSPSGMSLQGSDTWIGRCRIAAIVSGVLLIAAFLIALVVVARAR